MNPLAQTGPANYRFRTAEGFGSNGLVQPRLLLVVSPPGHKGKTFLAIQLAHFFSPTLLEADSGATVLRRTYSDCLMVDLSKPTAVPQLRQALGHDSTVLVDNANLANAQRLGEIAGDLPCRVTVVCIIEERRPGTKEYLAELRAALGSRVEWLIVRNQYQPAERRYTDYYEWESSAERTEYRKSGGQEMYLPVLQTRLAAAVMEPEPRPLATAADDPTLWGYYRSRIAQYNRRLEKSLGPLQKTLLARPQLISSYLDL